MLYKENILYFSFSFQLLGIVFTSCATRMATLQHCLLLPVQVKLVGSENVNWETFVYQLHPYRDPTRLELIKDGSVYQKETKKESEPANRATSAPYKPDVFKLTEPRSTPSAKGERLAEDS